MKSSLSWATVALRGHKTDMNNQKRGIIVVIVVILLLLLLFLNFREVGGGGGLEGMGADINGTRNPLEIEEESDPGEILAEFLSTNLFTITLSESDTTGGFGGDFDGRLALAGGKSGDVQISLIWNTIDDLDLHCIDPNGEEIYFSDRRSSSGGELDVDMNAGERTSTEPVENIYWPRNRAPAGTYKVYVKFYGRRSAARIISFKVAINHKGTVKKHQGQVQSVGEKKFIGQFRVN